MTPQTLFAMQLGVGADYLVTRHCAAGLSVQYLFAPADLLSDPLNLGTNPFAFTATARASYLFSDRDRAAALPPRFFWAWARNTSRMGVPSKP